MSRQDVVIPGLGIRVGRFLSLFVTLLLAVLVEPLSAHWMAADLFLDVFVPLTLLAGVYTVSDKKRIRVVGLVLAALTIAAQWGRGFSDALALPLFVEGLTVVFLAWVAVHILRHLFRTRHVTADTILASLCVYLLMGFVWAFLFALVAASDPGSFRGLEVAGVSRELIYFSFVTLTTLGYGDIVPRSDMARTLAIVEAAMGQLYVAVMIARLVGLHIAGSGSRAETGSASAEEVGHET